MDMENIPEELLSKRDMTECNFIFSLYSHPEFVVDYKHIKNNEDIITDDGIFYYGVLQEMVRSGYSTITDMAITTFCEDKEGIKKGYKRRGGWAAIQDILDRITFDNIEVYYDELVKSNMLIRLHKQGFNVIQNIDKFSKMNPEEVYDFFEYHLANAGIGKIEKIKSDNLSEGYDKWIDEWDKNPELGYPVGLSMLNYQLAGIHKKNLTLHLANIGKGKTTSAIAWYILPAIEEGNNVCIIANEQDCSQWRQMILATVMFNKLDGVTHGLNRHKMLSGHFTPEQKARMREAAEWLEKQEGKIEYIDLDNYDISSIKRIITKYSKIGFGYFIVDTFKPPNDASERAWAEFSETAKALFMLSKTTDTAIVCTAQLTPESATRQYLDLTCVGKSRAIAETASTVVMFRSLSTKEKESIKAYSYEGKIKKEFALDPEKDYIMIFTPKNRYGKVDPQIIVERNMDFNSYKQIGRYDCPFDIQKR